MLDDIAKQIAAGQCVLFLGAACMRLPSGSGYVYTRLTRPLRWRSFGNTRDRERLRSGLPKGQSTRAPARGDAF